MSGLFFKNKKNQKVEVVVSVKTVLQVVLVVLAVVVVLATVQKASHALTLIFVALFLALGLNAPVHWLSERLPGKKRGNRTLANGLSFIAILLILAGFAVSIVPPLVKQTGNFIDDVPRLVEDVRDQNSSLGKFVRKHNLENQIDKFSDQLSSRLDNLASSIVGTFTKITSSIFTVVTVLVLIFMMLIEGPRWLDLFKRFLPKHKHGHADKLAGDMYKVIKGYVDVQIFLAAIAAVFVFIPLLILDVSYPVALMVVVFISGLIPMVGHTIGAVLVSLIALVQSPTAAIIIFIYYVTYQQIENYLIQPRMQANATNMSPLLVFSSLIIGVSLSGLLGGLVAIPIAGCLRILVLDYVNRRNLLEPAEEVKA